MTTNRQDGGGAEGVMEAPADACRKCGAKRGEPCAGSWTTCEGSAVHLERNAGVGGLDGC